MINFPLPRLDKDKTLRGLLYKYCRLNYGDIWTDPEGTHRLGCLDASDAEQIGGLMGSGKGALAVQDPPYNLVAFQKSDVNTFIDWCKEWIAVTDKYLKKDCSLYVWLGADQNNHYQPFGEFMVMMNSTGFNSRSLITMRNQRGYGTQKNWMSVRQELLYYTKGNPVFNIEHVYTDIPKILKGYYKEVGGKLTENMERSKSEFIRAGNVWVDVQQVFHLMEENVNGCYAQKPLKSIERIINVSSKKNDIVLDFFSHAGTTLLACEKLKRKCRTVDIDPIYCEISIRRLERFRKTGKSGWQNSNPFADEILDDMELKKYLIDNGIKIPKKLSE